MYPLPPLTKSFDEGGLTSNEAWQEPRLLRDQNELNVLCVGTSQGSLHLYAFGLFHIAAVNFSDKKWESIPCFETEQNDKSYFVSSALTSSSLSLCKKIVNITPSPNMNFFSVLLEEDFGIDNDRHLISAKVETSLVATNHAEVCSLAQKYGQIHAIMAYIGRALELIEEAWESALLEMDAKLASYASSSGIPGGGVAADFLDLLVFGHASSEFEVFLTTHLTEKSLKRLRHVLDLCYSTMQRLVVRHLQQVGVTLIFLLSQVEGMSKRKERFGPLGVCGTEIEEATGQVGSFLLKAVEMLQAIETSMRDFHVFVRWISGVHLRLQREHVPTELSRMSQQETSNLLRFLNESFEEVVTGTDGQQRIHFRLERAGQYLKREELKTLSHTQPTPFAQLVVMNPALAAHRLVFTRNPRTSLLQEHQMLTEALTKMGAQPGIAISASIQIEHYFSLTRLEPNTEYTVAQTAHPDGSILGVVIPQIRQNLLLLIEWPQRRGGFFNLEQSGIPLGILDAQFYSSETLSLLLLNPSDLRNPSFAQISIPVLRSELTSLPSNAPLCPASLLTMMPTPSIIPAEAMAAIHRLEAGPAASVAVSGPRRVAALIGENRRRVRLYEMEAEDDDEEEDNEEYPGSKNESSLLNGSSLIASDLNETA